jgi:hypothetical protein
LLILLFCRKQFDLHRLSFSPASYIFNCSKISLFILWLKSVYSAVLLKYLILIDVNFLILLS